MNNKKSQIAAMVRDLLKTNHSNVRRNVMRPQRDWTIGIFVGVLLLGCVGGWSVYVYVEHRNGGGLEGVNVEVSLPAYNAALVDQAKEVLTARSVSFGELHSDAQPVTQVGDVDSEVQVDNENASSTAAASAPDSELVDQNETSAEDESVDVTNESTPEQDTATSTSASIEEEIAAEPAAGEETVEFSS